MVNPKSLLNLKTTPFSATNQPENAGRKPGSKNRKTILREWLSVPTEDADGNKITQEDAIVISMIGEAKNGNVAAAAWLFDGLHGKIANVQINEPPKPFIDYSKYSSEELQQLEVLLRKGMPDNNGHIDEAEIVG